MKRCNYFKLETFGAVDGPGLRMVLFMQGCPLRCLYCHNPESWQVNSNDAKTMSVEELIEQYQKYENYYNNNGGITLSGGEPLLQKEFCLEAAKACKQKNIHLTIDTSGIEFKPENQNYFKELINYVDLWLIDIKHIKKNKAKIITGSDKQNELELIKFLELNKKKYWIRQVIVPELTDDLNDIKLLAKFVSKLNYVEKFEFLPYHNMMLEKYKDLGVNYKLKNTKMPTKKQLTEIIEEFKEYNKRD